MTHLQSDSFRWTSDNSGSWLCIKCSQPQKVLDRLQPGKQYDIEIKQHRERRSLDANAYLWVLLDKLADALTVSNDRPVTKEELYREMIKSIPGTSEVICVQDKALPKLIKGWKRNGLGWSAETFDSKIEGCTNVTLYFGSSIYDTKQMSRLIDLVISECKLQGIETMTPEQLARLEGYE